VINISRSIVEDLADGAIHVWMIDLDIPRDEADRLSALLSESERSRARRRVRPTDASCLTVTWGKSREILAAYLDCSPEHVPIDRTEAGKPILGGSSPAARLSFSLSHSALVAYLAVAAGQGVGVDLERVRPTIDAVAVAARFFTARECRTIGCLAGSGRRDAFFQTWARKEAYLKGLGQTVPADLRRCEISSASGGSPRVSATELEGTKHSTWSLRDLSAPDGYVAALALEGRIRRIAHFSS
jgi:4'-phosphopantetheinyl transferase